MEGDMKRQNLSVTALIIELTKLSTVAALTATTILSVGTNNLQNPTEFAGKTVELIEPETDMRSALPAAEALQNDQPALGISSLAPAQSVRPKARPTSDVVVTAEASGIVLAQVEMVNHNAIRNLPITESLKENISRAVGVVYGPGFKVQVYSGGQHDHETADRLGVRRVGTKAHDHGHAADIYVIDPQGQRITGNALATFAQYWLATGKGGVGLEMRGGGIHLDEGRVRFWDYAKDGGSITKAQLAALVDGKRGEMPTLHTEANSINAAVPNQASLAPEQREASEDTSNANVLTFGVTKTIDGPIKIHGQLDLVEFHDWSIKANAKYVPQTDSYVIGGTATYEVDNLLFSFSGSQDSDDNTELNAELEIRF